MKPLLFWQAKEDTIGSHAKGSVNRCALLPSEKAVTGDSIYPRIDS